MNPVERALVLLAAARPGAAAEELAALALGRRDAGLLRLRESIFGPVATAAANCPHCAAALEFTVDIALLATEAAPQDAGGPHRLAKDGFVVEFRLPASADLTAIASCAEAPQARQRLLERCVLETHRDGAPVASEALPEPVVAELAAQIERLDPTIDIQLDLRCAACGHAWPLAFDIAHFLWHEIDALARRLLGEVHTLARVYGWSEADILGLSIARRNYYLEMAG
ncbi:MAG: phage baseplate protein [Deltaproteobacteria bacterium]|nr:phage baseplate protein [Deltaproteobacteria bacterium]